MDGDTQGRGAALVAGGERIGIGPQPLARLITGGLQRLLDRMDAGLETGAIRLTLPDGSQRALGGRAPGFDADLQIHDWRALLRLATSGTIGAYQGWEAG